MASEDHELIAQLETFAQTHHVLTTGWLSVMLVVNDHGKPENSGLPLDPKDLVTEKGKGQVKGLGRAAVQRILKTHGILQVLSSEAGRTNRGSVGKMEIFVELLNSLLRKGIADPAKIENWVISKVEEFIASKPFVLRLEPGRSVQFAIRDLISQAQARQKKAKGSTYVGTVLVQRSS